MKKIVAVFVVYSACFNFNNSFAQAKCVYGDCRDGYGVLEWESGAKYLGEFKNGKCDGTGIMIFDDGSVYSGDWEYGQRTGYGTSKFLNGTVYCGQYENNQFNGFGAAYEDNGTVFFGSWLNGKKNGYAFVRFLYEGEFHYGVSWYVDGTVIKSLWAI